MPGARAETANRREPIGSIYLSNALQELLAIGDPALLYHDLGAAPAANTLEAQALESAFERALADVSRARFSRQSLLLTAFAAEAYVNGYLLVTLAEADFAAVDRLPTVEKYVVGVRLAAGADIFDRGASPLTELKELFRTRDRLVHAKPAELPENGEQRKLWRYGEYRPAKTAAYLVATADAAWTLEQLVGTVEVDPLLAVVKFNANRIKEYAREIEDELPGRSDGPRLTYGRLSELCLAHYQGVDGIA